MVDVWQRILVVIAIVAMTICAGGCETIKERQFVQDKQFCTSIGATGPTYTQCMMQRDQQRQQAYNDSAQMDAQRLAIYSQLTQPAYHPIQTNCVKTSDITATCTTY